jgi:hypothetical protein
VAKRKVNKSAAIRDLYAKNPKMPVRLAVETLASKGIKVASSQVYFVLGGARGKAKRRTGQQRRATIANQKSGNKTGMSDPVMLIMELKAMADRAGGIANIKRLVDVLAE